MRWIVIILGVLVAILVAIALAGAMLPREHTVTRSIVLKQSPEAVWAVVTDHANEPKWRPDVETVTVTSSLVGGSTDVAVTSASQRRNRTSGKQGGALVRTTRNRPLVDGWLLNRCV